MSGAPEFRWIISRVRLISCIAISEAGSIRVGLLEFRQGLGQFARVPQLLAVLHVHGARFEADAPHFQLIAGVGRILLQRLLGKLQRVVQIAFGFLLRGLRCRVCRPSGCRPSSGTDGVASKMARTMRRLNRLKPLILSHRHSAIPDIELRPGELSSNCLTRSGTIALIANKGTQIQGKHMAATTESSKLLSDNRQAGHNFFLFDRYEAGMVLTGTEVKAAKSGKVQLRDAYAMIDKDEAWLHNAHISRIQPRQPRQPPARARPQAVCCTAARSINC